MKIYVPNIVCFLSRVLSTNVLFLSEITLRNAKDGNLELNMKFLSYVNFLKIKLKYDAEHTHKS